MNTELTQVEKDKLVGETRDLVARAKELTIVTEQDNTAALTLTAIYKKQIKVCKEVLRPTEEALKASKDAFNGLWDLMITPLEVGVKIIGEKSGDFMLAENRRRAELQRIEDEKVAVAQRKIDDAYAARCAKAAVDNKPLPVAPVIVPQRTIAAVYTPPGTSQQEYWSAEVISLMDLCKAVVEGKAKSDCIIANMPYLNGVAKLDKKEGIILPGVLGKKRIGSTQR